MNDVQFIKVRETVLGDDLTRQFDVYPSVPFGTSQNPKKNAVTLVATIAKPWTSERLDDEMWRVWDATQAVTLADDRSNQEAFDEAMKRRSKGRYG